MAEDIGIAQEFVTTVVDLSVGASQVVTAGPCAIRGSYINEANVASVAINDASGAEKFVLPASSPIGAPYHHFDATQTGITVVGDAGVGEVAIVWKPFSTALQFTPVG
jgi:hypothetical protein